MMNDDLTANTEISHYRVVSKIGAGGMGEVYLAEDTRLDRKVAIKFLHEEFSKDPDKLSRFVQEAKAASALRSGCGGKEIRRAIELDPNYATAHQWLGGDVLYPMKRFDEAIASLKRAEELDPLSPIIGTNLGDALLYARRYDEAIAQYKRVLSLDPNFGYAFYGLGSAYWLKGMKPEAIAEIRKYVDLSGASLGKGELGLFLAKSGQRDEAVRLLGELKQESLRQYVPGSSFALIHLGLGEKEEALDWLEKEFDERGPIPNAYAVMPELDELRAEPRFKAMLKRLNLPE